jgi:hypothetical protein
MVFNVSGITNELQGEYLDIGKSCQPFALPRGGSIVGAVVRPRNRTGAEPWLGQPFGASHGVMAVTGGAA